MFLSALTTNRVYILLLSMASTKGLMSFAIYTSLESLSALAIYPRCINESSIGVVQRAPLHAKPPAHIASLS